MLDFVLNWYMGAWGNCYAKSYGGLIASCDGKCHRLDTAGGEWVACWCICNNDLIVRKENRRTSEIIQRTIDLVIDTALNDGGCAIIRLGSQKGHSPCTKCYECNYSN